MRISLKFYACVGSNHTTLDAVRRMQARHPFGAHDVKAIVVHGSQVTMDHVGWPYRPEGLTSAQLNLPFCVATLLLEGDCFVDQFSDAIIADKARMALAEKVSVRHDAAITAQGSEFRHKVRAEVQLYDGTRLEETVDAPRGSEHAFASEADIVAKFMALASHTLPKSDAGRIVDIVLGLDQLGNAMDLVGALSPAGER